MSNFELVRVFTITNVRISWGSK